METNEIELRRRALVKIEHDRGIEIDALNREFYILEAIALDLEHNKLPARNVRVKMREIAMSVAAIEDELKLRRKSAGYE